MTDRADVKVLPPFVLLGFLGLESLVAFLAPMRALPVPVALPLGIGVIAGSIVVLLLAIREIVHAKTAFDVRRPTTKIIASGVFHVTRNPVYLSMILLVIGVGLILDSLWSILLALPLGSVLCLTIIRPEERYLEGKFRDAYRAYRDDVPRWLSARRLFGALWARSGRQAIPGEDWRMTKSIAHTGASLPGGSRSMNGRSGAASTGMDLPKDHDADPGPSGAPGNAVSNILSPKVQTDSPPP